MHTTVTIPISAITVGERRREDYGDIVGLAESIANMGLMQPIVVDAERRLIAGGRRLAACKHLGWVEIPATVYGPTSDARLREMELEENLRRLALSGKETGKFLERSRLIADTAEKAAAVLRDRAEAATVGFALTPVAETEQATGVSADSAETAPTPPAKPQGGFLPESGKKSFGRPPKPDSEAKVAAEIKIPQQTINDARQTVAAVERYPVLRVAPTQDDALKMAKKLDAMPEPEREQTITAIRRNDPDTLAALTDRPPVPKGPSPHALAAEAANSPEARWSRSIQDATKFLSGIRRDGISGLTRKWGNDGKREFLHTIRRWREELGEWEAYLAQEVGDEQDVA